jgi:hypothetical protein
MDGGESFVLISWEALAFVFAILPGIVGIAYCYTCGCKRERPTWSGYWNILKIANRAKREAYRKTAEMFASSSQVVSLLAWVFALIVALVSPSRIVAAVCLLLCVPASVIGYYVGRSRSKPGDEQRQRPPRKKR